jgi:hypothetical protein
MPASAPGRFVSRSNPPSMTRYYLRRPKQRPLRKQYELARMYARALTESDGISRTDRTTCWRRSAQGNHGLRRSRERIDKGHLPHARVPLQSHSRQFTKRKGV